MCIIMIPLATTELGTDGAITGLNGGTTESSWPAPTLVSYLHLCNHDDSSFWFAGPIVAKLGPLGLLATSAVLAIAGFIC